MTKKITDKQLEYLKFIGKFQNKNQRPPKYKEFVSEFNVGLNAIFKHLKALEAKGYITKKRYDHCSIRIII